MKTTDGQAFSVDNVELERVNLSVLLAGLAVSKTWTVIGPDTQCLILEKNAHHEEGQGCKEGCASRGLAPH